MEIMRSLVKEGKSIILITHKLKEIMEVCDRCTVIRKGKGIGTVNVKDTNLDELASLMVGREVKFTTVKKNLLNQKRKFLKLRNLCVEIREK